MCFKRIEVHPFLSSMYLKLHILPLDFLIKPVAEVLRPHLRQLRYFLALYHVITQQRTRKQ